MPLTRKKFLFLLPPLIISILVLDGFWFEKYIIDWTKHDLTERDSELQKIKIVQLTDLHIREIKSFHKSIARKINRIRPDLVVLTGDSINYNSLFPVLDELLGMMDLSIPKLAIMGNKEYEGRIDIPNYRALFKKYNGLLLINEAHVMNVKGRSLNIIGIDDLLGGNPDFALVAKDLNPNWATVVLNHCPEYTDTISRLNEHFKMDIKMVLSGHTHGGQVTFFGKDIFKPEGSGRYLKGWYPDPYAPMYVSRGIGTTALPIRFGARAEACIFYI